MSVERFIIVECIVEYNDGRKEFHRPTVYEISDGILSSGFRSATDYLHSNLKNVKRITLHDILYFPSKEEYDKYITMQN